MRVGRTIPPAAAPIRFKSLLNGFRGIARGQSEVERFRAELQRFFGVKHCFLVSSGKAGLALILQSLLTMHPERDEVIIPAFCCYSVPSAITRAGLKIRLCDVNPETLDFNFDELDMRLNGFRDAAGVPAANPSEPLTENRTPKNPGRLLAVVSTHLFGLSSDVLRVRELLHGTGVTVVEDAAQALGTKSDGRPLGTIGDVGFFSLGRGKAFSTVEGGIIVTDRDDLAENIRLRLGSTPPYSVWEQLKLVLSAAALAIFQNPRFFWFPKLLPFLRVGDTIYDPNFKIRRYSTFQAGLSRDWLRLLKEYSDKRQETSALWALASKPGVFLHYSKPTKNSNAAFIRFPIRLASFDMWQRLRLTSEREGLGVMVTYPGAINRIEELKHKLGLEQFPSAQKLAREILTLPVHPLLSRQDIARIKAVFRK